MMRIVFVILKDIHTTALIEAQHVIQYLHNTRIYIVIMEEAKQRLWYIVLPRNRSFTRRRVFFCSTSLGASTRWMTPKDLSPPLVPVPFSRRARRVCSQTSPFFKQMERFVHKSLYGYLHWPKFLYYLFAVILTYQILEIHERDGISFQSQKITKKIRADIMPSQKSASHHPIWAKEDILQYRS